MKKKISNELIERQKYISDRLSSMYEKVTINGDKCFLLPNGNVICVTALGGEVNALIIEFADNIEEAQKYNTEDGRLYYTEELDPEEMLDEMLKEIGNELK